MVDQTNIPGIGYFTPGDSDGQININGTYLTYQSGIIPPPEEGVCSDVTSWFLSQLKKKNLDIQRVFTVSGSSFTDRVMKWPVIKRNMDKTKPISLSIPLNNDDKTLNVFVNSVSLLNTDCFLKIGLTHPTSGDEFLDVFKGTIEKVGMSNGVLNIGLMDRFKGFSEIVLGDTSSEGALQFVDSDHYPGDLMWTLVTCYGGLSSIESTSNPDIDYAGWEYWQSIFFGDNIRVHAKFTGQNMADAMVKMSKLFDSSFVFEHNKLRFIRENVTVASLATSLSDSEILGVTVSVDDKKIINKQLVAGGYSVDSNYFTVNVFEVDSDSQASYGVREFNFEDKIIWFTNSSSAKNLAERLILKNKEPYRDYEIKSNFSPVATCLGDGLRFSDSQLDVSSTTEFFVGGTYIDMDTGENRITTRSIPTFIPFILDIATYSALDQTYNYLL